MEIDFVFRTNSGTLYSVGDQHVWRNTEWIGLLLSKESSIRFMESAQLTVIVPDEKGSIVKRCWTTTEVLEIRHVRNATMGAPLLPVAAA